MDHVIRPEVLLLSSKFDFSTDHISFQLLKRGKSYLRLNRDQLHEFEIILDPKTCTFSGRSNSMSFQITPDILKSIYYRSPTFLREIFNSGITAEEQLQRSQWAAFLRSLILFEDVLWVNNPYSCYRAEIKPFQLYKANKIGFNIPETVITNSSLISSLNTISNNDIVVKTVDTGIVSMIENDAFIYSSFINKSKFGDFDNSTIPFIVQEALVPKIDIRVTFIGGKIYPIAITTDEGINNDWRLVKDKLKYSVWDLPEEVLISCKRLMHELDLNFGGIDLIYSNGKYYFIEVNPTGEWDWLVHHTGIELDEVIAEYLITN